LEVDFDKQRAHSYLEG